MRFLAMFGILLGIYMPDATADCWVVSNISGYSSMENDNYNFNKDQITNGVFQVSIDGENGNVASVGESIISRELLYMPISDNTLIGIYSDKHLTTLETWSITNDEKVLYTKVINSKDNKWSASRSMTGDVVGKCGSK